MIDDRRNGVLYALENVARIRAFVPMTLLLAGCSNLGYYAHAVSGQVEILSGRQPIESLVADPNADAGLREKLGSVAEIRDFAVHALGLPASGSFDTYVNLDRPYVVWNVFATPELSLEQRQWCYPITGCMGYRAYFSESMARDYASQLRSSGDDVYVGGVRAYSTLGWFADPVYSPLLAYSKTKLAGVLFHELAHERLYVPGDTTFNESFAMTVQLEGTRRWLEARGEVDAFSAYLERRHQDDEFVALLLRSRARLEALYASSISDDAKRASKAQVFADLRAEYDSLKVGWDGGTAYDGFFRQELNNASLAPAGTYHRYVPAFRALLADQGGDLERFYEAAEAIGKLPAHVREQRLQSLQRIAGERPRAQLDSWRLRSLE